MLPTRDITADGLDVGDQRAVEAPLADVAERIRNAMTHVAAPRFHAVSDAAAAAVEAWRRWRSALRENSDLPPPD